MEITIAFAVSLQGSFEKKHFGEAGKYQIHRFSDHEFELIDEVVNPFKEVNITTTHNMKEKADSIINYLLQKDVSILVSKRFGRNIRHEPLWRRPF